MKFLYISCIFILVNYFNIQAKQSWNVTFANNYPTMVKIKDLVSIDSNETIGLRYIDECWAELIRSHDQGKTWETFWKENINYDAVRPCQRLQYPAKGHIFLSYDGQIRQTKDYGKTWDTTFITDGVWCYIDKFEMYDTLRGAATASFYGYEELYITKDGWKTYDSINVRKIAPHLVCNILMVQDTIILLHQQKDTTIISRSMDMGKTWERTDTLWKYVQGIPSDNLMTIAPNGKYYLAGMTRNGVGEQASDVLYRSDDNGRTWTKIYDKENVNIMGLYGMKFRDSLNAVAYGRYGKILRTWDGGENWFQEWVNPNNFNVNPQEPSFLGLEYAGSYALLSCIEGYIFRLEEDTTSDVDDPAQKYSIRAYYNSESLRISLQNDENGEIKITLYDLNGSKIGENNAQVRPGENRVDVNIGGLQSGVYVYTVEFDGMKIKTDKISIVK
jgi:photosystem II stability/assembly factor-like uncharacterized protein